MEGYKNTCRDSGVIAYEISSDYIRVQFLGASRIYTYSYRKAGNTHVEKMKQFAHSGNGLNSYINRYVKKLYD